MSIYWARKLLSQFRNSSQNGNRAREVKCCILRSINAPSGFIKRLFLTFLLFSLLFILFVVGLLLTIIKSTFRIITLLFAIWSSLSKIKWWESCESHRWTLLQTPPDALFSSVIFNFSDLWFCTFSSTYQHTFKLKSLLQLNFIGWGWKNANVFLSVALSFHPRTYLIQSNYWFVFRWNYISRYARCRCHVYPSIQMLLNCSGFS